LIIKGPQHVLVDFGMTGPRALQETARLDPTDIEFLLPTHLHADHVGGIEAHALLSRYVGIPFKKKPKPKAILSEELQTKLWDRTLRGGMEYNESVEEHRSGRRSLTFGDYYDVIRPKWKQNQPREILEVNIGGIQLEMFRTRHIPNGVGSWEESFTSFGLFVDGHVFISVDTRFDEELIDQYKDRADVWFHDCQLFEPESVHATIGSLRTLPAEIKRNMYLMHYGDNYKTFDVGEFAGFAEQGVIYRFAS